MKSNMLKKTIAALSAMAMAVTMMAAGASAAVNIRADNVAISNCRTYPDLMNNQNSWVPLKNTVVYVDGVQYKPGTIYGMLDYDIIGDDDVRCKVSSSAYTHYAIITTKKDNDATKDIAKGKNAITSWIALAGNNGDVGWANFAGGYHIT